MRNNRLNHEVAKCIENVETAVNLGEIKNLKKLTGFSLYYRIRIGDYRIGIKIENQIVEFVAVEHRKKIYRIFP